MFKELTEEKKQTKWKKIKTEYPKVAMVLKEAPIAVGAVVGAATGIVTNGGFGEIIVPTLGGAVMGYEAKRTIKNFKKHGFSAPINDYTDATVGIGTGLINAVINPNATIGNSIGLTGVGIIAAKGIRNGIKCSPLAIKAVALNKTKKMIKTGLSNIENKEARWEKMKLMVNSFSDNNQCHSVAENEQIDVIFGKRFEEIRNIINAKFLIETDKIENFRELFNESKEILDLNILQVNEKFEQAFYWTKDIVSDYNKSKNILLAVQQIKAMWTDVESTINDYYNDYLFRKEQISKNIKRNTMANIKREKELGNKGIRSGF